MDSARGGPEEELTSGPTTQGVLLGLTFLPVHIVYVQFHPLVYLVKLHIEMNIADLIAKVVRASNTARANWLPAAGGANPRASLDPPRCSVCDSFMGMMASDFGDVAPPKPTRGAARSTTFRASGGTARDGPAPPPPSETGAGRARVSEAVGPSEARGTGRTSTMQLRRFSSII